MRTRIATTVSTLLAVLLAGCVSPSFGSDHYAAMASSSAGSAYSAVQAARLAAGHATEGRLTVAYVKVEMRHEEEALSHILSAFGTRQPPSPADDEVRSAVLDRVTRAHEVVTELRIAAYRGELDRLTEIAAPLEELATELEDLEARYRS